MISRRFCHLSRHQVLTMAQEKVVKAAGAVLFRYSGKAREYLLLKNAEHKTWAPPKGHLEEGESLEDCAVREIKEEIGDQVKWKPVPGFSEELEYPVLEKGETRLKKVRYFLGEVLEGEVKHSKEHEEIRWLPLKKALETLKHEDLKDLLRKADSFLEREKR